MKHVFKAYFQEMIPIAIFSMLVGFFAAIDYYYFGGSFYKDGLGVVEGYFPMAVVLFGLSLAAINGIGIVLKKKFHPFVTWMFRPLITAGASLLGVFVYFVFAILIFSFFRENVELWQYVKPLMIIAFVHGAMFCSAYYQKEDTPNHTNRPDTVAPATGF